MTHTVLLYFESFEHVNLFMVQWLAGIKIKLLSFDSQNITSSFGVVMVFMSPRPILLRGVNPSEIRRILSLVPLWNLSLGVISLWDYMIQVKS